MDNTIQVYKVLAINAIVIGDNVIGRNPCFHVYLIGPRIDVVS